MQCTWVVGELPGQTDRSPTFGRRFRLQPNQTFGILYTFEIDLQSNMHAKVTTPSNWAISTGHGIREHPDWLALYQFVRIDVETLGAHLPGAPDFSASR